jgi:DNA polymerase-3 subunit epsilon
MKRLYFDTETTGFPPKAGAPLAECPYIVQLAAILVDDEHGEMLALNAIIKPDGWIVPDGAAEVHGITTEKADRFGIPASVIIPAFGSMVALADEIVAHNIEFDLKLATFEFERHGHEQILRAKPRFCTMKTTTDLCKLPGRYGSYKWPKLIEAHQHFFGEGFDGAHDALADVRACQRVHRHLLDNNLLADAAA